ncbi:MAG: RNB domain-containing ribonuclease [Gaiellaceae bacterium]
MTERIIVEIGRRGKLVVGEPFFTPGTPLVLERKGLGEAKEGDLAVVHTGRGRARLERLIGPAQSIDAVLEGLLEDEGLRTEFEPHASPAPSFEGRADLRELVTFTIDPETAKDFDDALSVRRDADGVRVWVHIADVSYFVPAGSPLDRGASERGCSVYVPGRVSPMLPPELSDDLCSLRPHQDRLCVTVEIHFDARLDPGEPTFYRSVIRSDERFVYGRAEAVLAGRDRVDDPRVGEAIHLAERVALELRERRFARGALRVESREIAFAFDGRGGVERAWLESEPHAHALVEELMILANEAVAGLLAGRRREALFRVHERPDPQAVGLLLAKLADLGVPTPPAPDEKRMSAAEAGRLAAATSERVTEYVARAGRGAEAFPALVLRALKQARYDPRNLGHSGLASRAYCHFTSPIRRYPDLVVHRALLREVGAGDEPAAEDLEDLADRTSAAERAAAKVEYRADELCLAWLLESELFERGWETPYEGEITGVIGSGLFVRFGDVFEGYLPARRLPEDYFELNTLGTALVGRRSRRTFPLGDPIEVRVESLDRTDGKVELAPAA